MWDFDQRFKVLLDQVSFTIGPAQHKEWFIAALLPHIRAPLMQQKVADQQEALEISIKVETAPVKDNSGIAQIQAQLAEMDLELHDMKKGKPPMKRYGVYVVEQKATTRTSVQR